MHLSSIVFVCLAVSSTHGTLSDQERFHLFQRVAQDLGVLQNLEDAIARDPQGSGIDILSHFSPEWIARVHQINSEGPGAINARMQHLGYGLERFGKEPSFLESAFGSLHRVLFQYQYTLSRSFILDANQMQLMQNFLENDPYNSKPESNRASIDMRREYMSRFPRQVINEVCKWFMLGYGEFSRRVSEVGVDMNRFAVSDYHGEAYFRATGLACQSLGPGKRRGEENSQDEPKIPRK